MLFFSKVIRWRFATALLLCCLSRIPKSIAVSKCENDPSFTIIYQGKKRSCKNIRLQDEEKREELCNDPTVSSNCIASCGECCADDLEFLFEDAIGKRRKCPWIDRKNSDDRRAYCETFQFGAMVRDRCPTSCLFCSQPVQQCFNDDAYRVNYRGRDRSCNNIRLHEGRRKALCVDAEVQAKCPHTCGTCCVNQVSYKFQSNDGVERTCDWIAKKNQEARQAEYCGYGNLQNGYVVRDRCASACGFCFEPVTESPVVIDLALTISGICKVTKELEVAMVTSIEESLEQYAATAEIVSVEEICAVSDENYSSLISLQSYNEQRRLAGDTVAVEMKVVMEKSPGQTEQSASEVIKKIEESLAENVLEKCPANQTCNIETLTATPGQTKAPTKAPTQQTKAPTKAPTQQTKAPTKAPTQQTKAPTKIPTQSSVPTKAPVKAPVPTSASAQPSSTCTAEQKMVEVKINTDSHPSDTSWEVLDSCSGSSVYSGDFDADDNALEYYKEVCVDANGRYKFTILGLGLGLDDDVVLFEFDYSLVYDGQLVAETSELRGYGFETHFGEGSCCNEGQKRVEVKINTDDTPSETSWEILDTCSITEPVIASGDFGEIDEATPKAWYQFSKEVCVPEDGRYKFKISDSDGDGIDWYDQGRNRFNFEFDYSLVYDGQLLAGGTTEWRGSGSATHFGEGSCCSAEQKRVEIKINTDSSPEDTSWEILDACSESPVYSGDFGAWDGGQDYYQSSKEVCVDANGRYKFIISDSDGDGIDDDEVPTKFDYRLVYDGNVVAETNEFDGFSDEVLFGDGSCPKKRK